MVLLLGYQNYLSFQFHSSVNFLYTSKHLHLISNASNAATSIIKGSCIFLKRRRIKIVTTAIATEIISVNCLLAKTITAPAIAPIAAAVIPSMIAFTFEFFPHFLK